MQIINLGPRELQLLESDITKTAVDVIVNAANSHLGGGGGVDGAIHRAGGPEIMHELDTIRQRIGRCPAGSAVVTGAGKLPAQFVFHAVGPIYRDGQSGEAAQLSSCYRTCLDMAADRSLASISFPSISTGAYRFPFEEATRIALETVSQWLTLHNGTVHTVKLVQFDASDHRVYCNLAYKMQFSMASKASS